MKELKKGWRILALAAALTLALVVWAGCAVSEDKAAEEVNGRSLALMTWNVQNLFDGKDNGFEYDEYKESAGWSVEKYQGRINSLSAAINTINPKPDIILFQEIESLVILQDLARALSKAYSWSHFAGNPGAALGIGILSSIPLEESVAHSITIDEETTPRPVMETRVITEDGAIVIFSCHWKSKLGGDAATESTRRASARVILRRIRELWENEPELEVIIAGDLNENHDEFYKQDANMICALLPDDPFSAMLTGAQKDFIVLSKNKPPEPVHFSQDAVVMFSPWMGDLENGTYFYRYNWETIDHFLLSKQFFNNKGWEYENAFVLNNPPFTNASGLPVPYNQKTGAGLSDHLPLLITIRVR
ncbi:MAG: endonuclease/exonuclease/phosphatase family protein [Treponema sp.]|jgi:endonuclease/exonuclease/phosphatase family metal-dependent hydrolase|nr:endonuclease/exonuclease/phosphatase family protein [Treponema sp.]